MDTWIFRIELAVKQARAPIDAASDVALERSEGTCLSWLNHRLKKIVKTTGEMEPWATLKPAIFARFSSIDAEALVQQWKALRCSRSRGRGTPTLMDIENFWDNFDELLSRILQFTPEENHPNRRQIKKQILEALPQEWTYEMSIWMSTNKTATLTQIKDRVICLADASNLLRQTSSVGTLAIVAPETRPPYRPESNVHPGHPTSSKHRASNSKVTQSESSEKKQPNRPPQSFTCTRCGQTGIKLCKCTNTPKCTTCGGLHLTQMHDQARSAYLRMCEAFKWEPHTCYDRSRAHNKGWWEQQILSRKTRKLRKRRAHTFQ